MSEVMFRLLAALIGCYVLQIPRSFLYACRFGIDSVGVESLSWSHGVIRVL